MQQAATNRTKRSAQKGQAVIELIVSIIMFCLMIVMVISVSSYLYVQHVVVTAAREGVRVAALNDDLAGADVDAAEAEIVEHIQTFMLSTAGIEIAEEEIFIEPPSEADPFGERTVTVQIVHEMDNPLPAGAQLQALSGSDHGMNTFTVAASATMRYEE